MASKKDDYQFGKFKSIKGNFGELCVRLNNFLNKEILGEKLS